jgi:RNA polymerase sigma factor (TIGR02999 family)
MLESPFSSTAIHVLYFAAYEFMSDVTQILFKIESGEQHASAELLPLVYEELRKLAAARMASERPDHTLQATALVHEAYVRLVNNDQAQHWNSRGHFFFAAAEAMRRILIESARQRRSLKRGGEFERIELADDLAHTVGAHSDELLDFNDALDQLSVEDPQAAELVKLKLFSGLSIAESARILDMPSSTAYETWDFAKAWFACRMGKAV